MDTAAWKKKLVRLMEDNRGLIVLCKLFPSEIRVLLLMIFMNFSPNN
jgi:hypothetical protein